MNTQRELQWLKRTSCGISHGWLQASAFLDTRETGKCPGNREMPGKPGTGKPGNVLHIPTYEWNYYSHIKQIWSERIIITVLQWLASFLQLQQLFPVRSTCERFRRHISFLPGAPCWLRIYKVLQVVNFCIEPSSPLNLALSRLLTQSSNNSSCLLFVASLIRPAFEPPPLS